jgi:hypothetical protein
MQLNFGVGTAIGRRTDIANAKPSFLGVLQDLEIDIAVTLKELAGAYRMPIDVAPANMKVTGKAKFARIQGASVNNLLLGQTETDGAGIDMAVAEAFSVPSASPYTYQTANHAAFLEDLGVFYANGGAQLQPARHSWSITATAQPASCSFRSPTSRWEPARCSNCSASRIISYRASRRSWS